MDSHTILQLIEIVFAVAGLVFGFVEMYKRRKTETILKTITRTYPGDVAKIEQSCAWANTNVRDAMNSAILLPESEDKRALIKFLSNASGDTAASQRMSVQLFNQLLTFQEAQFGSREIVHPEKATLQLCRED